MGHENESTSEYHRQVADGGTGGDLWVDTAKVKHMHAPHKHLEFPSTSTLAIVFSALTLQKPRLPFGTETGQWCLQKVLPKQSQVKSPCWYKLCPGDSSVPVALCCRGPCELSR